ncbi:hypothetical protein Golax_002364 [Gossypium laxum]|uniref:Uncharacterized protein n=1 Tax=Gossypium laxum TaxID=34288 RepID=A0A7J9AR46_9ROSI|nr:hypothetical protein [Gossypium laxum]
MSQLMSMMGDIKRQIGICIPSNTKDNPRREGKEQVKEIALRSSKVLSSPENPTQEVNKENIDDFHEEPLEADDEPELKEVVALVVETLEVDDRSLHVHLKGALEDVLVIVHFFIIPVDFVVLYFEEDREIPILLGDMALVRYDRWKHFSMILKDSTIVLLLQEFYASLRVQESKKAKGRT